jgi:hypothetical protein
VTPIPGAELAATTWATEGLALQRLDGVNPERGGYDINYQMVGPLHAARYLPVCGDSALRSRVRTMMRRAGAWELQRIRPDGSVDVSGSTRIGRELYDGHPKTLNYYDLFEALVYGAQLVDPAWLEAAAKLGRPRGWWDL